MNDEPDDGGAAASAQQWAYLGPEATFTEQAALDLRDREPGAVVLHPAASVAAAIADVRAGRVDAACVPIENSVEGAVALTLDELTHGAPLMITAEAYVTVQFDLLVRPGTTITRIRRVGSHPHGHAQVRAYVAAHLPGADSVVYTSTAAAAAAVATGELDAAIASPYAGVRYGLASLDCDIGEVSGAVTRFVLLRQPTEIPHRTGNDRTSLVVYVKDEPGSLLAILAELAQRGINLTRLESRPARSELGKYFFLLDADGHLADASMADAIAALHRRSAGLRFLGSYPRAGGVAHTPPEYASPSAFDDAASFVQALLRGESP